MLDRQKYRESINPPSFIDDLTQNFPIELYYFIYEFGLASCQSLKELVDYFYLYSLIDHYHHTFVHSEVAVRLFHQAVEKLAEESLELSLFSKPALLSEVPSMETRSHSPLQILRDWFSYTSSTSFETSLESYIQSSNSTITPILWYVPKDSAISSILCKLELRHAFFSRPLLQPEIKAPCLLQINSILHAFLLNQIEWITQLFSDSTQRVTDEVLPRDEVETKLVWKFILNCLEQDTKGHFKAALLACSLFLLDKGKEYVPSYYLQSPLLRIFSYDLNEENLLKIVDIFEGLKWDEGTLSALLCAINNQQFSLISVLIAKIKQEEVSSFTTEAIEELVYKIVKAAYESENNEILCNWNERWPIQRKSFIDRVVNPKYPWTKRALDRLFDDENSSQSQLLELANNALDVRNIHMWNYLRLRLHVLTDKDNFHFLQITCGHNYPEITKYLLRLGVPLVYICYAIPNDAIDAPFKHVSDIISCESALVTACTYSDIETVNLLLEHANREVINAVYHTFDDVCKKTTALIRACERGRLDMVQALVEAGADVNQPAMLKTEIADENQKMPLSLRRMRLLRQITKTWHRLPLWAALKYPEVYIYLAQKGAVLEKEEIEELLPIAIFTISVKRLQAIFELNTHSNLPVLTSSLLKTLVMEQCYSFSLRFEKNKIELLLLQYGARCDAEVSVRVIDDAINLGDLDLLKTLCSTHDVTELTGLNIYEPSTRLRGCSINILLELLNSRVPFTSEAEFHSFFNFVKERQYSEVIRLLYMVPIKVNGHDYMLKENTNFSECKALQKTGQQAIDGKGTKKRKLGVGIFHSPSSSWDDLSSDTENDLSDSDTKTLSPTLSRKRER